jgi:FlaG/FlaF family flagellin (archaellin)
VISTILMIAVALLLTATLVEARRSYRRQARLEHHNRVMQVELERHRAIAQSILRELQNT